MVRRRRPFLWPFLLGYAATGLADRFGVVVQVFV